MITILFVGFLAFMVIVLVLLSARYLGRRTATGLLAALSLWFLYVAGIGYFGVVRNTTTRPPGVVFLFVPVIAFIFIFLLKVQSSALAAAFPLWIILCTQSFRVGVELFLHQLWVSGLIPKTLTYSGENLDIFIGASAPVIAWLSTTGRTGMKVALAWNVLGLFVLGNVVARAVLTAPGPLNLIHAEVPNLMIGTFPFLFIPGFFVPLAIVLHVLAIRAITTGLRTNPSP